MGCSRSREANSDISLVFWGSKDCPSLVEEDLVPTRPRMVDKKSSLRCYKSTEVLRDPPTSEINKTWCPPSVTEVALMSLLHLL